MKVTREFETFDVSTFPDDADGWDFWGRWADGRWEPEAFDAIDRYLTPDSTFVDIGAWIGPLTLWAARRCARVVALEPDPVARAVLEDNVIRNDLKPVEVLPYALNGTTGTGVLTARGHDDGGEFGNSMSHLGNGRGVTTAMTVQTISPTSLWDKRRLENVALVKIDIEGGEARLVERADFLRRQPLLLSYHGPWMTPRDQVLVSDAFDCDATTFGTVLLP